MAQPCRAIRWSIGCSCFPIVSIESKTREGGGGGVALQYANPLTCLLGMPSGYSFPFGGGFGPVGGLYGAAGIAAPMLLNSGYYGGGPGPGMLHAGPGPASASMLPGFARLAQAGGGMAGGMGYGGLEYGIGHGPINPNNSNGVNGVSGVNNGNGGNGINTGAGAGSMYGGFSQKLVSEAGPRPQMLAAVTSQEIPQQ